MRAPTILGAGWSQVKALQIPQIAGPQGLHLHPTEIRPVRHASGWLEQGNGGQILRERIQQPLECMGIAALAGEAPPEFTAGLVIAGIRISASVDSEGIAA